MKKIVIKQLRKSKKNGYVEYLKFLSEKYFAGKNVIVDFETIESNIEYVYPYFFIQAIIVDEIIDTLRRIKINDNNRDEIKCIMGNLINDKWFSNGYLVGDSTAKMSFEFVYWQICREQEWSKNF